LKAFLTSLARRRWPDFNTLAELDRAQLLYDLFGIFFGMLWIIIASIWLLLVTDLSGLRDQWLFLCLFLALSIAFSRVSFFQFTKLGGEKFSYNSSDLSDIALISAFFIFGPIAVWLRVFDIFIQYALRWNRYTTQKQQMSWARNLVYNLGIGIINALVLLGVYQMLGGSYPLAAIRVPDVIPAFIAILVAWSLNALFMVLFWFSAYRLGLSTQSYIEDYWSIIRQTIMFFVVAQVPGVFSILAAAIYYQMGFIAFLFFLCAAFLISVMARRLSQAVILNQQKSEELDQLEQLGRAIIASQADASELSGLLTEYVPKMLTYHQIEVRLFNDRILLQLPEDRLPVNDKIWPWLANNPQHHEFDSREVLPWSDERSVNRLVITPIFSTEQKLIGGICLVEGSTYMGGITVDLQPALQVLAAQIASALHGAEVFAQTLDHQRVSQELAFGGQIQASFLPDELPKVDGWQLAATLLPAKETSGDFYDVIPLSNGCLAIVVADVADKGVGAALFMALSRTLIRSYAIEHETAPERVLAAVNRRILSDASADLFITTFYGILNSMSGEITYANAGHNPPYLVSDEAGKSIHELKKTGMALGLFEENEWEQRSVQIPPGGTLVLYSDGITDAQNLEGEFFGEERLMGIIQANLGRTARELEEIISSAVEEFVDDTPQFDDITLVVLVRET